MAATGNGSASSSEAMGATDPESLLEHRPTALPSPLQSFLDAHGGSSPLNVVEEDACLAEGPSSTPFMVANSQSSSWHTSPYEHGAHNNEIMFERDSAQPGLPFQHTVQTGAPVTNSDLPVAGGVHTPFQSPQQWQPRQFVGPMSSGANTSYLARLATGYSYTSPFPHHASSPFAGSFTSPASNASPPSFLEYRQRLPSITAQSPGIPSFHSPRRVYRNVNFSPATGDSLFRAHPGEDFPGDCQLPPPMAVYGVLNVSAHRQILSRLSLYERAKNAFVLIDRGKRGYLDLKGYLDALRTLEVNFAYFDAVLRFARSDVNQDCRITKAEFIDGYLEYYRERAKSAFELADPDKTGSLDFKEFLDTLRTLEVNIAYHHALDRFANMDTNKDGRICEAEFINGYLFDLFETLDSGTGV